MWKWEAVWLKVIAFCRGPYCCCYGKANWWPLHDFIVYVWPLATRQNPISSVVSRSWYFKNAHYETRQNILYSAATSFTLKSTPSFLQLLTFSTLRSLQHSNTTQVWCVHNRAWVRSKCTSNLKHIPPLLCGLLLIIEYRIAAKFSQQIYIIRWKAL